MTRLKDIEDLVAGTLNTYSNLKLLVRSRPRFLDPQLQQGNVRFANKRGFGFSGLVADNKYPLAQTAVSAQNRLTLTSRPGWYGIGCLIRIGLSEVIGELQVIADLVDPEAIDTVDPLIATYIVDGTSDLVNYVSLVGTPGNFFEITSGPFLRKVLLIESWYKLVPGDSILASPTPDVLDSLAEYQLSRANLIGTRPGIAFEPVIVYRYEIELATASTLLTFEPSVGLALFVKAQPMFQRSDYATGDIKIPNEVGPCLIDAFYGGLIYKQPVETILGIKTYDSFGTQLNANLTNNQQWQQIPTNYLLLQRPIASDSLILWQRLQGNFQLKKGGFFQAELDDNGQFIMSSDLLVPKWPTNQQNGWVIPLIAESALTVSVQFEPQERQYFTVPAATLFFIRPKILIDPNLQPIDRIVVAIQGSPNSTVEIRDWEYDGTVVNSLSYYILGTQSAFGEDRWIAGGFCLKPVFFDLGVLKARYSDGVSKYNSGYIYT